MNWHLETFPSLSLMFMAVKELKSFGHSIPIEITVLPVLTHWELTSLLTQLISTPQLSHGNHTATDTNIPESQHSSSSSLHPRAWAEILQSNLHTKFPQESKLHPNEPISLWDTGPVPEILFCRLPQSRGSPVLCREDKLLHFPTGSRRCIHRRCPRGRSYGESRAQLPVRKGTLWGLYPHPPSAAEEWEWELWEMGKHPLSQEMEESGL